MKLEIEAELGRGASPGEAVLTMPPLSPHHGNVKIYT